MPSSSAAPTSAPRPRLLLGADLPRTLVARTTSAVNDWIHAQHAAGRPSSTRAAAVERFFESFIECGFDIINPVQCSADGHGPGAAEGEVRRPAHLLGRRRRHAEDAALRHARPRSAQQVLRRCEIFARAAGSCSTRSTTSRPARRSRTSLPCSTPSTNSAVPAPWGLSQPGVC